MSPKGPDQKPQANDRKARLAEELRANLARRKAQARLRKPNEFGNSDGEAGKTGPAEAADDERS